MLKRQNLPKSSQRSKLICLFIRLRQLTTLVAFFYGKIFVFLQKIHLYGKVEIKTCTEIA